VGLLDFATYFLDTRNPGIGSLAQYLCHLPRYWGDPVELRQASVLRNRFLNAVDQIRDLPLHSTTNIFPNADVVNRHVQTAPWLILRHIYFWLETTNPVKRQPRTQGSAHVHLSRSRVFLLKSSKSFRRKVLELARKKTHDFLRRRSIVYESFRRKLSLHTENSPFLLESNR
jgi:hypothetical protein